MNRSEIFSRAVAALPDGVRERLDGTTSLDWSVLADPSTVVETDDAVRTRSRLPAPVESLAERLVREVGIAPSDVVAGIEGSGSASEWIHWAAVEPDGESYRIRNKRSGELHTGIRPEFLVGYAVLGMELCRALHVASEAWSQSVKRVQMTPEAERDFLSRYAASLHQRLRAFRASSQTPLTIRSLGQTLEDAWNAQSVDTRAALTAVALTPIDGMQAPRPRFYAAEMSYRLHAFDVGEARWLQALAERAQEGERAAHFQANADPARITEERHLGTAVTNGHEPVWKAPEYGTERPPAVRGPSVADSSEQKAPDAGDGARWGKPETPVVPGLRSDPPPDDGSLSETLKAALASPQRPGGTHHEDREPGEGAGAGPARGSRLAGFQQPSAGKSAFDTVRGKALGTAPGLLLGSRLEERSPQLEVEQLARTVDRIPAAVMRRLGEAHGTGIAQFVAKLQDPNGIRELRTALETEAPDEMVPEWFQELAAAILSDAGVLARDGLRTGRVRLNPERQPEGYKVIEVETTAFGYLTPIDFVEQVRLGLSFAHDTWMAGTSLGSAGKEAEWVLHDAAEKGGTLSSAERTKLEAAQRIAQELQHARASAGTASGVPSALQQADLAVNALKSVQTSTRASAGWSASGGVPDSRNSGDIARIVTLAEALDADVRVIANRLIAVWVATGQADGEARAR